MGEQPSHCHQTELAGHNLSQYLFANVGNEAFPLNHYMMQRYPGLNLPESEAVYNFCLSRVKRVIKTTVGILASR